VHAFIVKGFVYRGWLLKVTHFEMDAKSMRERNNAQANTNQSSQVFLMCMPETCLSVCVRLCVRVSVCVCKYMCATTCRQEQVRALRYIYIY